MLPQSLSFLPTMSVQICMFCQWVLEKSAQFMKKCRNPGEKAREHLNGPYIFYPQYISNKLATVLSCWKNDPKLQSTPSTTHSTFKVWMNDMTSLLPNNFRSWQSPFFGISCHFVLNHAQHTWNSSPWKRAEFGIELNGIVKIFSFSICLCQYG